MRNDFVKMRIKIGRIFRTKIGRIFRYTLHFGVADTVTPKTPAKKPYCVVSWSNLSVAT